MKSSAENVLKVQQALEDAGAIFIDQNEESGPGDRLSPTAVLIVVHTERSGKTRLISARKANRQERKRYDGYLKEASQGH